MPSNRFINGDLSTTPDGSVRVDGTVGALMPDGSTVAKTARAGHTFFPANWTRSDIMAAGVELFETGAYKKTVCSPLRRLGCRCQ
ncbi:hypothetical protein AB0N20_07080 [Streptomyces griseoincarnatus]